MPDYMTKSSIKNIAMINSLRSRSLSDLEIICSRREITFSTLYGFPRRLEAYITAHFRRLLAQLLTRTWHRGGPRPVTHQTTLCCRLFRQLTFSQLDERRSSAKCNCMHLEFRDRKRKFSIVPRLITGCPTYGLTGDDSSAA